MARLIGICSNGDEGDSFFALRDDGRVYRCTLTGVGPSWERIGDAPNTAEDSHTSDSSDYAAKLNEMLVEFDGQVLDSWVRGRIRDAVLRINDMLSQG